MRAPFVSTLHIAALAGLIAAALAGCASAPPPRAAANAASAAESVAAAASVTEAPAATASAATPPAGTAMAAADTAASAPAASDSGAAAVAPGGADEAVPLERRFADWVAQFRTDAQAQGIADATLSAALDDVHYLPRVVELDRAQPEFTRSVWDYLDITVSPQRVTRGQARLQQVRASADDAAARYGVPATVLAAIWGIESNFGELMGSTSTIDALATLGFDGRRAGWARSELLAALKILQSGDVDRAHMVGSWAGAMATRSCCRRTCCCMRWMPMATAGATSGPAPSMRWRRPPTSWRAPAGAAASRGAPRCNCPRASTSVAPTARCV
jgi:hypothetical protein